MCSRKKGLWIALRGDWRLIDSRTPKTVKENFRIILAPFYGFQRGFFTYEIKQWLNLSYQNYTIFVVMKSKMAYSTNLHCFVSLRTAINISILWGSWENVLNQGLSKHQEVCFTPVTKITKLILAFWDLFGAIKNSILKYRYQTDHKKNWWAIYFIK